MFGGVYRRSRKSTPAAQPEREDRSSSFSTRKINKTTFLIVEDDSLNEHPFIYAKVHPEANVLILSDTGCDEPSKERKGDRYVHLREYLEKCKLDCNDNRPLNPDGQRKYIVICTHCHDDHIGGIMHFLRGGTTAIIASAAGRDFIESDRGQHSLFDQLGKPKPYYQVTHWAQSFERLHWPLRAEDFDGESNSHKDLALTIIQTPGHTPDELAWYDHAENHLYVGDSFYEEGPDDMPTIWPRHGNLIDWYFSMQKLQTFVRSRNAALSAEAIKESLKEHLDYELVPARVKVGCGHQTATADAEDLMATLMQFWHRVLDGSVPVVDTKVVAGEVTDLWAEKGQKTKLSFLLPRRLMDDAREFFAVDEY